MSVAAGSIRVMETSTAPAPMTGITDRDREILEFERSWWKYAGAKETAVRERFDLSYTAYYARVNWLLDQPEALEHDPMTVRRLRRLRDERKSQRTRRR